MPFLVLQFFKAEERATINGINAVAFNIGTAIILWQMQSINLLTGGWQNSLTLFSIFSLVIALLWLLVKFEQPQRAIAPGQYVAFYDDEQMIGGAVIEHAGKLPAANPVAQKN